MNPPTALHFLLLVFAGWVNRRHRDVIDYLLEENRILRQQLGKRRLRLTDDQRRRLAVKGKLLGRRLLGEVAGIVTPDTILRWYRQLVSDKYDGSSKRGPGRPGTAREIVELVVRIAKENPRFGYTRLRDTLYHLGHEIGRSTVKRILLEHSLEPAPERGKKTSWKTFIKAHAAEIAEADFFTVEVLTLVGLVRFHVFFLIKICSRRVEIAGISDQPHGHWMEQLARNLTDAGDGFLMGFRYLLLDRDPLYTDAFRRVLRDRGVEALKMPARSPNLRPHAERFVRSIKEECIARIIPLGERHLRRAAIEFGRHYHSERPHQGLAGAIIEPGEEAGRTDGAVVCRERLGGVLRYYYRDAA